MIWENGLNATANSGFMRTALTMILKNHLSVQNVYNSVINFVVFLMHCTNYDLMILHMQLQMKK